MLHAKKATAVGSTIGRRIHTSRSGDANVRCTGSGGWVRYRNSPRYTRPFTTTSITSAISSTATPTRPGAPRPWRNGGILQTEVSNVCFMLVDSVTLTVPLDQFCHPCQILDFFTLEL